ncbi:hypothetical protein VTL71DRAFT_1464 [Oculimacula yallundae]|uniref:Heterokaryon incompatibility domain-containing protein n=1 Tax=Oculimacula yallundae TaxID=86028 RepID=A0ABR4CAT9_9HELO
MDLQQKKTYQNSAVNLNAITGWDYRCNRVYGVDLEIAATPYRSTALEILTTEGDPAIEILPKRPIPYYATSEISLKTVMGWLENCLKSHVSCPHDDVQKMPSRVVEIMKINGILQPKLINTAEGQTDRWVALSYCWGRNAKFFRTTIATLETMLLGIEMSAMPLTYQHALEVTSLLGYRYIWIDALCIVQDDLSDKDREIKTMHNIYRNAILTIAVDSASSAEEGFLWDRSIAAPESIFIRYKNRGSGTSGQFQLRTPLEDRRETSVLDTRGWSLQENLLSPRTLHFGRQQLFWDCQCTYYSEGTPYDRSLDVPFYTPQLKATLLDVLRNDSRDTMGYPMSWKDWLLHRWYLIINDLSRRSFSNEDDILPAISAIVEEISNQAKLTYHVGVWEDDIHRGLLWRTSECRSKSGDYRAPSWSWACMSPPYWYASRPTLEYYSLYKTDWEFNKIQGDTNAKILEMHIEKDNSETHASQTALPGSFICIRTIWSFAHEWKRRPDFWFTSSEFADEPYNANLTDEESGPLPGQIVCDLDHPEHRTIFSTTDSGVGFLLIAQAPIEEHKENGEKILWCLIIQPQQPDDESNFTRLGIARIPHGTDFPEPEWTMKTVKIF